MKIIRNIAGVGAIEDHLKTNNLAKASRCDCVVIRLCGNAGPTSTHKLWVDSWSAVGDNTVMTKDVADFVVTLYVLTRHVIKGAEDIGKGISEGMKALLGQKKKKED